ncbi:hypothetical protein N1851_012928 [Merluccius polli]|uniref:Reverse transcriptase domain-containing protein n=1 Tax=Merluccius polli TaxID=89951 RepID=A0AA47MVW8_MERPO|nr:hypothetical protein N1851_012928 [Merluccius polli]
MFQPHNFSLRVSARSVTSDWHRLDVGIIPGCTISVILFALLHHLSDPPECRGLTSKSRIRQPPICVYMNDLTVTTEWVKPAKSRSLVLKKGRIVDKFRFSISEPPIPTISEKPVKSLGKILDSSRSTEELEQHLPLWKHLQTEALPDEFNVLRTREVLQFQDSNDPKVSRAGIAVKTGRKWRMEAAVEQAESQLCN